MLDKFSEMVRGNLSKMERLKIVALVTIEVYTYIYTHTLRIGYKHYTYHTLCRSMLETSLRNC